MTNTIMVVTSLMKAKAMAYLLVLFMKVLFIINEFWMNTAMVTFLKHWMS